MNKPKHTEIVSFALDALTFWNDLPDDVSSVPTLTR